MTEPEKIIEVGDVAENGLRLWCARTALDNAERALSWQTTTLNIFISRATALIGWNVTLSMATLTIYAAYHLTTPLWILPCFVLSAVCCGYILLPKSWEPPYTSIPYLLNPILERMAGLFNLPSIPNTPNHDLLQPRYQRYLQGQRAFV